MSPLRAGIVPLLLLAACGAPSAPGSPVAGSAPPGAGARGPGDSTRGAEDAHVATPARLRVLVLSGGSYHDFASDVELLVDGVRLARGVDWTFLPLGDVDEVGVPAELRRRRLETMDLPGSVDVVLAYTQGDLGLSALARERLLAFVRDGGGFVGLHCAADSHPGWDEYTAMLGGRFASHPPYGRILVRVDAPAHPVTAGLPYELSLEDEFYHLEHLDLDEAAVLMTGISPAGGARRPVTWVKPWGAGRVVYTILGHDAATHGNPRYRQLVGQALEWAGQRPGS